MMQTRTLSIENDLRHYVESIATARPSVLARTFSDELAHALDDFGIDRRVYESLGQSAVDSGLDADDVEAEIARVIAERTADSNGAHLANGHATAHAAMDDFAEPAALPPEYAGELGPEPPPIETPRGMPALVKLPQLDFIDVASLAGTTPPERQWLVQNRIPLGKPCLLTGDGAAGKTTIALQLAGATVRGTDWLNALVDHPGPAMVFSAEEDHDELHRRVAAIADHHQAGLEEFAGLHLLGMPGGEALLGMPDRAGIIRPTPTFDALHARAREICPVLIVIEAAADVFAGNENDRAQVNQFIGILRRLCTLPSTPAVVLIAHPSLSGMASGSGTSGSTGWSNSVRSRLYFAKASKREGDDTEGTDDIRELRVMKANYGPSGEVVKVRWTRGVFVPEGAGGTLQRAAAEADADAAYLACLDAAGGQGRAAYPNPGRNYAPKMFAGMPQAQGTGWRALATAQERLFATQRIHAVAVGPPSRQVFRIERKPYAEVTE